jgi:hypothetical protein
VLVEFNPTESIKAMSPTAPKRIHIATDLVNMTPTGVHASQEQFHSSNKQLPHVPNS